MDAHGAAIIVQGFGNVGSIAAQMFAEAGSKIVGISDVSGGYHNPNGIDVGGAVALRQGARDAEGLSRRGAPLERGPAGTAVRRARAGGAREGSDGRQRAEIKAKLIVEARTARRRPTPTASSTSVASS